MIVEIDNFEVDILKIKVLDGFDLNLGDLGVTIFSFLEVEFFRELV